MQVNAIDLLHIVLTTIYYYLPAAIANMAPVMVQKIPGNWPIWQEGLGENKTWRGLLAGIIAATVIVFIQKDLSHTEIFESVSIISYQNESAIYIGILFGAGALIGDAIKSYVKRKLGKPPGSQWRPADQLDFILGTTLFLWMAGYWPGEVTFITALILCVILHPAINWVGFVLKLKSVPW